MKDAYRNIAGRYDRLFEKMNKGLRVAGMRMFRPAKGMNILDVGCGTGAHLELYQRYGCVLYGIDSSPSMLAIARTRLGDSARLELGDAARMPFEDQKFDLILCMLALHEMAPQTRSAIFAEMRRVLKIDGRILLIDFHPGPYQWLQGWKPRLIISLSELLSGGEHHKNYRQYMAQKGLPTLVINHRLSIEKQDILAGGTFAIFLVKPQIIMSAEYVILGI